MVETRTVTSSSGVQKFTTTTAASNSELTFQVDYKAGLAQEKGKTIQHSFKMGMSWKEYNRFSGCWTPIDTCRASTSYCGL